MIFDAEKFCRYAETLDENQEYKALVGANLPNDGGKLSDICAVGLKVIEADIDRLVSTMRAG